MARATSRADHVRTPPYRSTGTLDHHAPEHLISISLCDHTPTTIAVTRFPLPPIVWLTAVFRRTSCFARPTPTMKPVPTSSTRWNISAAKKPPCITRAAGLASGSTTGADPRIRVLHSSFAASSVRRNGSSAIPLARISFARACRHCRARRARHFEHGRSTITGARVAVAPIARVAKTHRAQASIGSPAPSACKLRLF